MLHCIAFWDRQQPGGIEIHYLDIFLHVHWLLITDIPKCSAFPLVQRSLHVIAIQIKCVLLAEAQHQRLRSHP